MLLWFNFLCSDRQIVIPLRSILAVGVGRIRGQMGLGLIVDFVDPASGMEDQVIFLLREPQRWKMLIEAVKGTYFGELERRVSQRFVENQIIAKEIFWANLQFQRSLGPHQVLGNGALVLTPDMLWFTLLLPDKQIEIPLQNIRTVQIHTQQRRSPLLVITFVDATTANEDQVMFTSKADPQYWKRMIDETIQGGQNRL